MGLREQYTNLLEKYKIEIKDSNENIIAIMRESIDSFMNTHKRVAVYCYGEHTKALMVDFIFELRDIVCIIDNGDVKAEQQGFEIIKDEDIERREIDGIIISSYRYRDEIKDALVKNHSEIDFLDFYDEMNLRGVQIEQEFFTLGTPYQHYIDINKLYQELDDGIDVSVNMWRLLGKLIEIKDFRLAFQLANFFYRQSEEKKYLDLANDLNVLWEQCLNILKEIGEAVLLLCVDGLKAEEICEKGRLKKTYSILQRKAKIFTRAYSYSTSTYESLLPVFSENYNQKTGYMKNPTILSNRCRFIKYAKENGRNIYMYTCGTKYIDDPQIKYAEHPQTITQMLWNFLNDLEIDANGLFYIHMLYESHFTFPSPYFKEKHMVVDGTSLFFDFLSTKGSKLRGKYSSQYDAAMRYIDDTLAPLFNAMTCRTFFFADHGNNNYEEIERNGIEGMTPNDMTACEELLRIPMAVISPEEIEKGENSSLISLAELNDIALSLMRKEKFDYHEKSYIKIGRTAIYNPDYKYIYKHIFHSEHSLCAFEGFIFIDGYKLLVFSNGTKELYRTNDEYIIQDDRMIEKYYHIVEKEISIF